MSALLRSGKFLRLVSGIARNNTNNPNGGGNGVPNLQSVIPPGGADSGQQLIPCVDHLGSFQAWSLQHLESALPTVGANHSQQDQVFLKFILNERV